ncbi:MAG: hypothetical protein V4592_06570 [Bacteroidota bacterium]
MKNIGLFIIACALVTCNKPVKKQPAQAKIALKLVKPVSLAPEIQPDIPNYPADTVYPARILSTGVFHNDEVDKKDGRLQWMGLFKNDSSYYLSPFNITLSRVKDEIVDERPGEKTGWEVKTGKRDSAILLIGGLNYLKSCSVKTLLKSDTVLLTGHSISLF